MSENTLAMIFSVVCALAAFFGAGMQVIMVINLLTFTRKFARTMVDEGVIERSDLKRIMLGRVAGLFVTVVFCFAITGALAYLAHPYGVTSAAVAILLSLLRFRKLLGWNVNNAVRFARSSSMYMNKSRFDEYMKKAFGISVSAINVRWPD